MYNPHFASLIFLQNRMRARVSSFALAFVIIVKPDYILDCHTPANIVVKSFFAPSE